MSISSAKAHNFRFSVSPQEIRIGEKITLQILHPGAFSYSEEEFKKLLPPLTFLQEKKIPDGLEITLTSYKPGNFRIPPLDLQFGDHNHSTEAIEVKILSGRGSNDNALREGFGKVSPLLPWRELLSLFLLSIAVALIVRILWARIKKIRSRHTQSFTPTLGPTAEEWLALELERIARETGTSSLEYYERVCRALREYSERVKLGPARSWTPTEWKQETSQAFNNWVNLFSALDLARYEPGQQFSPSLWEQVKKSLASRGKRER